MLEHHYFQLSKMAYLSMRPAEAGVALTEDVARITREKKMAA